VSQRGATLLRVVAVGIVLAVVGAYLYFTLSNASYTLGCDYGAYDAAARRWLAGDGPYDLAITQTGSCGTYQYPPPFLLAVVPFTLLSPASAAWAWVAVCVVCLLVATAIMPVPFEARLITLALAGTSWPMLFAIKVGALGPVLLLVFAAAWRWLDRPARLAVAVALGALVKLQPALLVLWMLLTRRWRAALMTAAAGVIVVGAGILVDRQSWIDFFTVVRTLSGSALDVPANFAPASIAYFAGASEGVARGVGVVHTVAVLLLVVVASLRARPDASLLVTVVASQMVAPVMWDHYIVVLFLPIAWLLARKQWWVLAVGVGLNAMFVLLVPPVMYVVAMDMVMLAITWVGRQRSGDRELVGLRPATTAP
jgi:alpha-1,2-mannosyltransferase